MKQTISLILFMLIVSASAWAQSGTDGNISWNLTDGVLTISGSGDMNDDLPTWYSYRSSITSVEIQDGVTSIGNYAFLRCGNLTSLTIPNSVTIIGNYAFANCYKIDSVTIPNSVTSIGDYAFYCCNSLTSIAIPNAVTNIGSYAFFECFGLTSLTIGCAVTIIGDYAFAACYNIDLLTIPNSVTSIGDQAFCFCNSLTSVIIGSEVVSIGNAAFADCWNFTSVIALNSVPISINYNVFFRVDKANCTLIVPASSVDAYKAAAVWQDFNIVGSTGIDNPFFADIKVHSSSAGIEVLYAPIGASIEIYTINGVFVTRTTETVIPLLQAGVYIVKVGDYVTKVVK